MESRNWFSLHDGCVRKPCLFIELFAKPKPNTKTSVKVNRFFVFFLLFYPPVVCGLLGEVAKIFYLVEPLMGCECSNTLWKFSATKLL